MFRMGGGGGNSSKRHVPRIKLSGCSGDREGPGASAAEATYDDRRHLGISHETRHNRGGEQCIQGYVHIARPLPYANEGLR